MTAMDMQTKYLQMLEEKTGLFRSIDARKRELTELDAAYEMLLIKAQELETRVKEMQSLPSPPQQEHDDYEDEEHDLLTSHEEGSIRRDSADAVETQRGGFDRIENADNEDDNDALIVVGTPIEKTHMEVVSSSSSPAPSSTGGSTRTSRAGTTNYVATVPTLPNPSAMASPDLELSCLVPWTTIMKESHGTGTISSLRKDQRDRLDAAAAEFLEQFYEPEDVAECKVLNGKRECIGLPPALCEAFMDWLDIQIDSGILDKKNLDKRKRFDHTTKPDVATDDSVEEEDSAASNSRESSPPAAKKQRSLSATPSSSQKKGALNRSGYIPWINLLFSIMPEMRQGNYSAFAPFVTEFLRKHSIPDIRIVGSNGRKARAIPKELEDEFRAEFEEVYAAALSPSRNYASAGSSTPKKRSQKSTGRIPSSPTETDGVLFFDASSRPRQSSSIDALYKDGVDKVRFANIFKCLMPTYNSAPKLIRRELKEAVKKYLIAKLGSESKFNDLAMVSTTQGNTYWTFGVPYDMRYEFREWAIKELRRRFGSVQVPEQGWEENN